MPPSLLKNWERKYTLLARELNPFFLSISRIQPRTSNNAQSMLNKPNYRLSFPVRECTHIYMFVLCVCICICIFTSVLSSL